MQRKDYLNLVTAFLLLIFFFLGVGSLVGAGLQLVGVEVPVQRSLVACVYWGFAGLAITALVAGLWKVINEP